MAHPAHYSTLCRGKKLASLFFEPSTRTRLSFEAAMYELGGNVLGFSEAQQQLCGKGGKRCRYHPDGRLLCRYHCHAPSEGGRAAGGRCHDSTVPIINAGDGGHNHPTQTLTDLLTIHREKGRFERPDGRACAAI